jgi:hypothetical protein
MAMMKGSSSTQDSVSYDQFIGMLDENLKRRHQNNAEGLGVEDSIIN